jgi:uncharacterized cofD-like protein
MAAPLSRRAVAIGGGTGLPAVLKTLLDLGFDTTAVVTMADDGGSSGALRRELGMLPPGDVRNCLVALAEDPSGLPAQLFQYRFEHGEGLSGHALGNLIIAALSDMSGDFAKAIEVAGAFLGVRGRVLPSTLTDVVLHGIDRGGNEVIGQARLANNPAPVAAAFLEPQEPEAYAPAIEAIRQADAIVIGPGSLYTSLVPNFLVAGIAPAVFDSKATRVYVCNVANMRGETHGLDAADHVQALVDHGLEGALDVALVHHSDLDARLARFDAEPVENGPDVIARITALGIRAIEADFADEDRPVRHSPDALRRVLGEVLG